VRRRDYRVGDLEDVGVFVTGGEGVADFETDFVAERVALSDGLGGMISDFEGVLEAEIVLLVVGV